MKRLLVVIALLALNSSFSQNNNENWTIEPFSDLGFTENIGRYENVMDEQIEYFANYGPYLIFFSNDAFIIGRALELSKEERHERIEKIEHGEETAPIQWNYFKIEFQSVDPESIIEPLEIKHHTRNFSNLSSSRITKKAHCFNQLLYKNIYPNIDLILELPEEGGLKYSFHVHPGGNYEDIVMKYDNINVQKDNHGKLKLANETETFSDAAPTAISNTNQINVEFECVANEVRFTLADYDRSKELVIDPWIETDLPFDLFDRAYEIGYDNDGNCMIMGNNGEMVSMYNNTGVLEWTWGYPETDLTVYGDLATKPSTGDTYFSLGIGYGFDVIRLDVTGVLSASYIFPPDIWVPYEFWRLWYNEVEDELYVGLGGGHSTHQLAILDPDLTAASNYMILPPGISEGNKDIAMLTASPDGDEIYLMPAKNITGIYDNIIYKLNQIDPFTIVWEEFSNHNFIEIGSVGYSPYLTYSPNGYNGLVCSREFLFSYDGDKLKKYDKDTGDPLDSLTLGKTVFGHGGIDVDECGGLYIGTDDSIVVFNSDLERIGGYAIPGACYDLRIGDNKLYASGFNFVMQESLSGAFEINLSGVDVVCESCDGSVSTSITSCAGYTMDNIIWSPGGESDEVLTDLCSGWYVATVTFINDAGDEVIVTDSVEVVNEVSEITVDLELVDESCAGSCNGSATISASSGEAPYVYSLGGATNGTGIFDGLCAGTHEITVVDANGCDYIGSIVIVSDESLGLSVITLNEPTCYGFTDGSITVETAPGVGEVTYSWIPENPVEGATFNNLGAGIYIAMADDGDCTDTLEIILNQPDSIWGEITITDPLCYGDSSGYVVVDSVYNAQGDLGNVSFYWAPNYFGDEGVGVDSAYSMPDGDYTLTINDDNGCSNVIDFTITEPTELVFSELGYEPAYCRLYNYQSGNGVVFAAATGGRTDYQYGWINNQTGETVNNSTWGGLNPGTYTITVIDDNGCILTETIEVDSVNPIAAFTIESDQLDENCEGTELVVAQFTNQSEYFANPNNPISDSTFFWNFDHPTASWIISHDLYEVFDTSYTGEDIYQVCLVAINKNGCTDTTCKDIIVHVQPEFVAPNIFSPGSNGVNDEFTFEFLTLGMETFHCTIVNRWGVKVAELNSVTDGWDGTDMSGDECTNGVYFYSYEAISTNHSTFTGQGNVQLVRK